MQVKAKLNDWLDYFKIAGNNKEGEMETLVERSSIMQNAHEIYK